ncbi:MAG: hypothetical protein J7J94_01720, partial [Thaumarchaeota archaeon]|nr:hypothetical protein [Nitrososphaerota archaeon]
IYDYSEPVIVIEALATESIKYIRTITLRNALTEYDRIDLLEKLRDYYNKAAESLDLAQNMLKILEARP